MTRSEILTAGVALADGDAGLTVADFSNTSPILLASGVDILSAKTGGKADSILVEGFGPGDDATEGRGRESPPARLG